MPPSTRSLRQPPGRRRRRRRVPARRDRGAAQPRSSRRLRSHRRGAGSDDGRLPREDDQRSPDAAASSGDCVGVCDRARGSSRFDSHPNGEPPPGVAGWLRSYGRTKHGPSTKTCTCDRGRSRAVDCSWRGRLARIAIERRGGAAAVGTSQRRPADRAEGRAPPAPDDADREAAAAPAALGRAGHRPGDKRLQAKKGVGGVQPDGSREDQPLPAHRGGAVAAAHPDPVRLRHDPRLPHDLPGPARRREQLRSVGRDGRRHDRRARDRDGRHQADLQPDGRRLARAALGPDRRGRR